jgi:hypothetical protein
MNAYTDFSWNLLCKLCHWNVVHNRTFNYQRDICSKSCKRVSDDTSINDPLGMHTTVLKESSPVIMSLSVTLTCAHFIITSEWLDGFSWDLLRTLEFTPNSYFTISYNPYYQRDGCSKSRGKTMKPLTNILYASAYTESNLTCEAITHHPLRMCISYPTFFNFCPSVLFNNWRMGGRKLIKFGIDVMP